MSHGKWHHNIANHKYNDYDNGDHHLEVLIPVIKGNPELEDARWRQEEEMEERETIHCAQDNVTPREDMKERGKRHPGMSIFDFDEDSPLAYNIIFVL